MRPFSEIALDLKPDGALRDFYISDMNLHRWQDFLDHVRPLTGPDSFQIDGVPASLPQFVSEIFNLRKAATPCLSIPVGPGTVCCHFFEKTRLELDFVPEPYLSEEAWMTLYGFLDRLCELLGHHGAVCHENAPDDVIQYILGTDSSDYPDRDFPYTFYFQGIEMPKYSNQWWANPPKGNRHDQYIDLVYSRIDHVGNIESEEADNFLIVAQEVLLLLLTEKEEDFTVDGIKTPELLKEIRTNLISGYQQMIRIADQEEVIFWTSGYPADLERLNDAIRRFKLGPGHPDYFEPRHRRDRRDSRLSAINWQRGDLRRLLPTLGRNKPLKTWLHNLKDKPNP